MATLPTNIPGVNLGGFVTATLNIPSAALAAALLPYVTLGSQRHRIDSSDLQINVPTGTANPSDRTFVEYMSWGNCFFDVLLYMSLAIADRPAPDEEDPADLGDPFTANEICIALFYQYFFIMTRGAMSGASTNVVGRDVPKFLYTVMGFTEVPNYYIARLMTFAPEKLDPRWVRHVPFNGLAQEYISRAGLGVAGYRMIAPFKHYRPMPGIAANLLQAYEVARSMATQPASWDIHSATRSPAFLNTYGPINKNAGNLMLAVFTPAQIAEMVSNRMIYATPVFDAQFRQFESWDLLWVTPPNTLVGQ